MTRTRSIVLDLGDVLGRVTGPLGDGGLQLIPYHITDPFVLLCQTLMHYVIAASRVSSIDWMPNEPNLVARWK